MRAIASNFFQYDSAKEVLKWSAKQYRLNQHFKTAKEVQAGSKL